MVPIGEMVKDEVPLATLQHRPNSIVEYHALKDNASNGVSTPQPGKIDDLPLPKTEKMDKLRLGDGGKASPKQSGHEGSILSSIREKKVSEDGYNWRKYGQKLVKGNEYVRSYYRCTHPNCLVKRQIERLHDGKVVDIVYLGQHDHPKPQLNIPVAVGFAVSIVEERPKDLSLAIVKDISIDEKSQTFPQSKPVNIRQVSNVVAEESTKQIVLSNKAKIDVHTEEDPDSKRQKKDKDHPKSFAPDKPTNEPRVVTQTVSEVDIVNDGYRWRKYGQKLVKGNPNPRSYYRCSNSGCPMKKHVERASHDPKTVMTTYEGQHSHDMPQARIVTHNAGDSTTKSHGNSDTLVLVADAILEHRSELEEQNGKLACRSVPSDANVNNPANKLIPVVKSESNSACLVESIKSEKQNPDTEPIRG